MSTNRQRAVTVATGVTTIAATVGGSVVGLATPAQALTAPTLNTTTCVAPNVATYNAAALAAYKKSAAYTKFDKPVVAAKLKLKKAKTPAAKKAAALALKKAVAAAAKNKAKALAAWTKLNTYSTYAGVATPPPVASDSTHPGTWNWGVYTTRILVKGGKLVKVCTAVNESAAGPVGVADTRTPQQKIDDLKTSQDTYQGINKPMSQTIPGTLPVLWFATTFAPSTSLAAVTAHVNKCATDAYTVTSAVCPKGGLTDPVTHLTGATYTVNGYQQSLQKALTVARANHKIL
jgi:hypothetical protein